VGVAPPRMPGGTWKQATIYSFTNSAAGKTLFAGLVEAGGVLYGTAYASGAVCVGFGCGTVYELTPPATPGSEWTESTIYSFAGPPGDGENPMAGLTLGPGGVFYGATLYGGSGSECADYGFAGCGTVFQLTPPAAGATDWTETILYNFTGVNGDGAYPSGSLAVDANGVLYGTTQYGGSATSSSRCTEGKTSGCGTVFKLTPPTTPGGSWTETVLHSFAGPDDGAIAIAGPTIGPSGAIFGTTSLGGAYGDGTVFAIYLR